MTLPTLRADDTTSADIIVYGGTSGAVIAAVQAHKEGKSVIMISPDKHLGGLTSSGLGWADVGRVTTIGGLSKDFFHRVWLRYNDPTAWKDGVIPDKIKAQGQGDKGKDDAKQLMYVFEPKVAEAIFNDFITENKIAVVHARLDLNGGVLKDGARITGFRTEDGRIFHGKMYIDATYEGDLMAKANVKYTVGREASSQYGERLDGLQVARAVGNQLPPGIDPYIQKGVPASGLLPGVNPTPTDPDGTGDKKIQAYCYRLCLTTDPANYIAFPKPEGYREEDYELLFRAIDIDPKTSFIKGSVIPNHKTDTNNFSGISLDYIGMNYDYPDADYATREKIAKAHENWQRGYLWTLHNSERVPQASRDANAPWGLAADEFTDNNHWPYAFYVREARRMVSDYVLTEPILEGDAPAARPIAIGSYTMDSHNVQRIVGADGMVHNEGDVQEGVKHPYQLDYGVILPKSSDCENLLVTFAVSATHISFGSVRMESVFMMLNQSAATAAALAIDNKQSVQDVPYDKLQAKLIADGQLLDWKPLIAPKPAASTP